MTTLTSKEKKSNEDENHFTDILSQVISQWNENKGTKKERNYGNGTLHCSQVQANQLWLVL